MTDKQFSERVEGMERRLYRISRTILSSDADCQDGLQEALIKAWMRRGSLRGEGAFDAWLIRILINECRILARGAKRHRHDELDEALAAPPAPDRALHDALRALEEKYRLPVALHYVEGYRVEEIAKMLRAPVGTVKSRLHYGRRLLKDRLEKEAGV